MKYYNVAILLLVFILPSCSSPKQDGENYAQEECEMWDEYVQNTIMTYTNFVKEFGRMNYQSRTQAREDLNQRIDEVETKLASHKEELQIKYSALLDKYKENREELKTLSNAYYNSINAYEMDTTQFAGLRSQANEMILTIIPHAPNPEKMQKDLMGRTIKALPGGYLNNYWSWIIKHGDIKNLQIVNIEEVDRTHKEYVVEMTLQRDGTSYKTNSKVYYVLDNRDDWEIDMLEPSDVEVIKTGRYNSSITTSFYKMLLGKRIEFNNNSDAALLVGFTILDDYGNYKKQSLIVGGGETASYIDLCLKDYTIDFVERP